MTQATKQCWSCTSITPWDEGWCSDCQKLVPGDIEQALVLALSEPFAGAMRAAVSDHLRVMRARAKIHLVKKLTRLDLDDLEI